jgi:hypothetical protein
MTLAEYLDPYRFPLTTHAGFTPRKQLVIDALDLDLVREYLDEGGTLDDRQAAWRAELEEKEKARPWLFAELYDPGGAR